MDPVRPVALKKYCPVIKFLCRNKSRYLAAKDVRRRFVDFFLNENHNFIRSSSVKPYNDPSLEFVNAGMNQFKNVFLGIAPPPALRATNSQKCIRIGGKHNDLNTVGHDSYHHTFFEMLGNWSFGDYFKKESCEFAWNLLTSQPYSLEPDRLYTTYFGGDASLNLPPDNETKEIWEKIGVHKNRIIPFGLKDNFWEMGSSGPCGPCTELHYDHKGTVARPDCVNRDLQDLTELWNIVFIQYNRKEDGNLELLEQNFVDTGMGLERLTALLQGKNSNYDTDLFMPLFETISEVSGLQFYKGNFGPDDVDGLDTKYRILADHARMIAIAIADNVLPENSHGLRRVIRKSLIVSEQIMSRNQGVNESFVATNLLLEVIKQVSLVLHSAYPEVEQNIRQMEFVLRNESNLWINLRESVKTEWKKLLTLDPNLEKLSDSQNQGLINACRELHSLGIYSGEKINRKMALTFYDRYGLSSQLIEELASIKGLKIDMDMLIKDIKDLKEINKAALMVSFKTSISGTSLLSSIKHCDLTDDSAKFQSRRGCNNEYVFDPFFGKVEAVFCNEKSLSVGDTIKWYDQIGILFDKTNFWSSNGDENDSDIGHITLIDSKSKNDIGCLLVDEVYNYSGFIIHYGKLLPIRKNSGPGLLVGKWKGKMIIDPRRRLAHMRNTTASHLINHVLKSKHVCNIQNFGNYKNHFYLSYYTYGQNVTPQDVYEIEKNVNEICVTSKSDVTVAHITVQDLLTNSDIYVPSFVNTKNEKIQLISFTVGDKLIREVTVGPNVANIAEIGKICFVDYHINSKLQECVLKAVAGTEDVTAIYEKANEIGTIFEKISEMDPQSNNAEIEISRAREMLSSEILPLTYKVDLNKKLEEAINAVQEKYRHKQSAEMEQLIEAARANSYKCVVHYVGENAKLEKLTRMCPDLPVLLFAYNRGHLTARCCVPQESELTAVSWINAVSKAIGGEGSPLKGHDPKLVFSLRPIKVNRSKLVDLVTKAKECAVSASNSVLQ